MMTYWCNNRGSSSSSFAGNSRNKSSFQFGGIFGLGESDHCCVCLARQLDGVCSLSEQHSRLHKERQVRWEGLITVHVEILTHR